MRSWAGRHLALLGFVAACGSGGRSLTDGADWLIVYADADHYPVPRP